MAVVNINYNEQVKKQNYRPSPPSGQKISEPTDVCPFCNLAVAPADSRRRTTSINGTTIPFLVDAMRLYLHKNRLPVPTDVKSPFDIEKYLRQIIISVVDKPLSESEATITSVMNIADRFGVDVNLNSIVLQDKQQELIQHSAK